METAPVSEYVPPVRLWFKGKKMENIQDGKKYTGVLKIIRRRQRWLNEEQVVHARVGQASVHIQSRRGESRPFHVTGTKSTERTSNERRKNQDHNDHQGNAI